MIVVTAATGQFGRLVVDQLLNRVPVDELAIAVRNPATADDLADRGVQVRYADYDEPESLVSAFRGADRLLFISSPDAARLVQHRNVVAAAGEAGVGMLAYTSGLGADMVPEDTPILGDHRVTEQAIKQSGVPYVMLRHPLYTELFINAGLKSAIEAGELTSSTGGRGMNTASRADLAEAAAAVLTSADVAPRVQLHWPALDLPGARGSAERRERANGVVPGSGPGPRCHRLHGTRPSSSRQADSKSKPPICRPSWVASPPICTRQLRSPWPDASQPARTPQSPIQCAPASAQGHGPT